MQTSIGSMRSSADGRDKHSNDSVLFHLPPMKVPKGTKDPGRSLARMEDVSFKPFSDSANRRNPLMKGFSRTVIGPAVGGFLGAAAFFAVDGLNPSPANSQLVDGDNVTVYLTGSETKDGNTVLYGCEVDSVEDVICYF